VGRGLAADDQVALEATGNSDAIANLLVARVVVSNPSKTRAIAEAKVMTDKIDARILAQLLAADSCRRCGCPMSGPAACAVRSCAGRMWCGSASRSRTRCTRSWPATSLPPRRCRDLSGTAGRHWLSRQDLPADERSAVAALLRQLDFHGGELAVVDKELAAGRSLTR
jgi:transposase